MSNLAFDTHKFVKDLTKSGMPDKQAEVLADHYARLLDDRLATKDDIALLRKELKGDMELQRRELKGDIGDLRNELDILRNDMNSLGQDMNNKITNLEERLINKLTVRILSAQIVTIVTICTVTGFLLSS
ncbi:MAG: coiled-coil domain-containing protein [Candidatus Puniceispirillaceae bacterium]